MKTKFTALILIGLVVSVSINIFLFTQSKDIQKDSIVRYRSDFHNIDVYVEKTDKTVACFANTSKILFGVGDVELFHRDSGLYLITPYEEINLSEMGSNTYIIKSDGALLRQFENIEKNEQTVTVYVTPSGKKYHYDPLCAGKTAFQAPLDAAVIFREPCNICT